MILTASLLEDSEYLPKIHSLDEIFNKIPVSTFHYVLLVITGFSFMAQAIEITLISFISICVGSVLLPSPLLILAHDQTGDSWDLTNSQIAMIGSIVFGGEIVGNLFWGPFADKYGRRLAFILGSLLIVVGGFLTVIAPNYALMVTFRGIVGFGVGGCTVPFDLLAEFLPNSHRGQFLMYIEYFWTLGCMFVVGFAWIFLPSYGWRALTLVSAIPVAIALVLAMIFLPESPRWLLSVNRKEEAVDIITKAAKFNGTPLEKFTLYSLQEERALGRSTSSEGSASNVEKTFLEFFQEKENLKISFPLWIVWGCFGLSYYGIILLTTAVYANDGDDDDSAGDDDDSNGSCSFQYQNIFLSACVESIGIVLATLLIDSWGRVPTQGLFNSICGVGVLFMSAGSWFQGTKTRNGMLLFFSFLARIGAMAAGTVAWVAAPELFPTEFRVTGHSIACLMSQVGGFFSPFVVSSTSSVLQSVLILSAVSFLAAIMVFFLPETAGKDLDKLKKRLMSKTEVR